MTSAATITAPSGVMRNSWSVTSRPVTSHANSGIAAPRSTWPMVCSAGSTSKLCLSSSGTTTKSGPVDRGPERELDVGVHGHPVKNLGHPAGAWPIVDGGHGQVGGGEEAVDDPGGERAFVGQVVL